ncbi:hypothetical protein U1Q18_017560 [Sarracenia purpurea var. burkii]
MIMARCRERNNWRSHIQDLDRIWQQRGSTGKICGENGERGNDLDSVDKDEWNRLPYPNNPNRVERSNGGGNKNGKRKELKSTREGCLASFMEQRQSSADSWDKRKPIALNRRRRKIRHSLDPTSQKQADPKLQVQTDPAGPTL